MSDNQPYAPATQSPAELVEYRMEQHAAKLGARHRSSVVELSIRNRAVVGANPTGGSLVFAPLVARRLTVSTSRVLCAFALFSGALLTCSAPLSSQSLIGRTTAELSAGDYVLPRFSPSGRFLVVSQVLADTATENTQILLLDFRRNLLDTLLPAKAAAKYSTCVHDPSFTRTIRRVVTRTRLRLTARWLIRSAISILASLHQEPVRATFSGLDLAGPWSMVGPSFCCRSASPALTMTCGCTGSTDGRLFGFCPFRAACVPASLGDSWRAGISSSQLAPTPSPFTATETRGSRPSSPFLFGRKPPVSR